MTLRTSLCDRLEIELPIVQAPVSSAPQLAAAVTNAGGLGILQASWLDLDELRAAIRDCALADQRDDRREPRSRVAPAGTARRRARGGHQDHLALLGRSGAVRRPRSRCGRARALYGGKCRRGPTSRRGRRRCRRRPGRRGRRPRVGRGHDDGARSGRSRRSRTGAGDRSRRDRRRPGTRRRARARGAGRLGRHALRRQRGGGCAPRVQAPPHRTRARPIPRHSELFDIGWERAPHRTLAQQHGAPVGGRRPTRTRAFDPARGRPIALDSGGGADRPLLVPGSRAWA